MVSVEMNCVRNLLFFFNLLFVISGIAIITVGAIIQATVSNYSSFIDASSPPIILIVVGVIVFVIAFFGCCGAAKKNHCMIITFAVFLLIIFTLELAAGIAGYVRHNEVEDMLEEKLNKTLMEYTKNKQYQKTWDAVQNDLQCCGIHGQQDWSAVFNNNTLPYTCCKDAMNDGSCVIGSKEIFVDGCLEKLKELVESGAYIIGGVGIGIAIVQLLGVVFSCALARSVRKEYETV